MTQEAEKKVTKPKVGKAPAVKVEAKPVAAKAAPIKAESKPSAASGKKVKLTQTIGSIGRRSDQEATLIGLGLNKRHRSSVVEDTPSVRGMIRKVSHLITVENVS
jgi:large subunit ribosomal protein L30